MGIDAPVHVSAKERDVNNVFLRIINAAEHPHLNVPETEEGRCKKRYRNVVNHSLIFISSMFLSHLETCIDIIFELCIFVQYFLLLIL